MSIDRSLKIKGALVRHRNVLSRAERIELLKEQERWLEGNTVFGLPKVAHRKSSAGKKEKAEKAPAEGAEGAVAAEAAPGTAAAPAAGAKAPAGAKPAAVKTPPAKPEAKSEAKKK
jgi:small basic protein (TIGR04137 family)